MGKVNRNLTVEKGGVCVIFAADSHLECLALTSSPADRRLLCIDSVTSFYSLFSSLRKSKLSFLVREQYALPLSPL